MNRKYRRVVIAGNWKMNKTIGETKQFINELKPLLSRGKWCDIILCVPFTDISAAVKAARRSRIAIAAQNVHQEKNGAYTGEVSADMLAASGVKYVVIGHSERRQYFGETDEMVNTKVKAVLEAGLKPIICVGESEEQRDKGLMTEHICYQIKSALYGLDVEQFKKTIIAYEPIWAIGTGKTATAEQADEVCQIIRGCMRKMYGARAARTVEILYGGSMKPSNSAEILAQSEIDGGLIGGASLDVKSFKEIIDSAKE